MCLKEFIKNNKLPYHMLKDLVVEDNEDVVRDSEDEKNICNGTSSGTEEMTTTTINMDNQTEF